MIYKRERWSNETILAVWKKGKIVAGNALTGYRRDICNALME